MITSLRFPHLKIEVTKVKPAIALPEKVEITPTAEPETSEAYNQVMNECRPVNQALLQKWEDYQNSVRLASYHLNHVSIDSQPNTPIMTKREILEVAEYYMGQARERLDKALKIGDNINWDEVVI